MRRALEVILLFLAACTGSGGGGAVVARWRLVDATTGIPRGSCVVQNDADNARIDVIVDTIRVVAQNLDTGEEPCTHCEFSCGALEGTTSFSIPTGIYSIGIEARSCGVPVGSAPPPVVRRVQKGEITNLAAVEILIPPCEHTRCEMGAGAARCDGVADGGP